MPTTNEAVRLNLEYYRKQAKALLKSYRAGDPEAVRRISGRFPNAQYPATIGLQEAQLVIAREEGYASWPKLKIHIEQSRMALSEQANEFVCAVCSDNTHRAKTLWAGNPAIAGAGAYVALATGDAAQVEAHLAENPSFAREKGGPSDWEPLVYVCFSRWGRMSPNGNDGLSRTAKLLLAHGADPNSYHTNKFWPDSPLPCLYGAGAVTGQLDLARLLLESGANPNDGESLYHCVEHKDHACLKLLLEYASPASLPPVLKHSLDYEDPEVVKLLVDAGAHPNHADENGENALHSAVWKGRSSQTIMMLLSAGARINATRSDGRTAYALAVCSGQVPIADLLQAQGADTTLSCQDLLLGRYLAARQGVKVRFPIDRQDLKAELGPEATCLVPEFAANHMTGAVEALLEAGAPVDTPGDMDGATALHVACLNGYADLVELLLQHGASLTAQDTRFEGTPVGWFAHGVRNSHNRDGDYVGTACLLISAGATFNSFQIPTGDERVDAVFREHGLIS